jgi:transketolase
VPVADVEQLGINVIRGFAMDAPQRANSGHPGTAMALAPLAHVLWTRIMKYDPTDPLWPDRDRFILSAGHASILLYSMLCLTGYGLEVDDLKQFRQWGSKTPGHPESYETRGVEVTTGPLGQGFANGVGMGIAERYLRARFGPDIVSHHTFVIASDGDLEEGISHEAASLAGHLQLGRLVYVYDDNHITIDGPTELSYSDDAAKRFEAYGWHVERVGEAANDVDGLDEALRRAMAEEDRPSLIVLRSHIGWPSPNKTDTAEAHGNPLGADEIGLTKARLGLPNEDFYCPPEVLDWYRGIGLRQRLHRVAWDERLAEWKGDRADLDAALEGRGITGWAAKLPTFNVGEKLATRRALSTALNATLDVVPGVLAGGADLTENTGTDLKDSKRQSAEAPAGRQLRFGIREHGMGGAMVGMARHGGVLPVGGTFFVFSDYMRGSVRLAALSQAKCVFVWTHDSVGLGEDGPTHQPIEHLASLRAMPGLRMIRPADANETAQAWRIAVDSSGPTALILTRQNVPVLDGTADGEVERGAYVLAEAPRRLPSLVLIGTGSEVSVCLEAAVTLREKGVSVRVVSMPSWDLFAAQPESYRDAVLPRGVPRLSVEAGSTLGWERYADASVGIDRFGASAPGAEVLDELGINPTHVAEQARALLDEPPGGGDRRQGSSS